MFARLFKTGDAFQPFIEYGEGQRRGDRVEALIDRLRGGSLAEAEAAFDLFLTQSRYSPLLLDLKKKIPAPRPRDSTPKSPPGSWSDAYQDLLRVSVGERLERRYPRDSRSHFQETVTLESGCLRNRSQTRPDQIEVSPWTLAACKNKVGARAEAYIPVWDWLYGCSPRSTEEWHTRRLRFPFSMEKAYDIAYLQPLPLILDTRKATPARSTVRDPASELDLYGPPDSRAEYPDSLHEQTQFATESIDTPSAPRNPSSIASLDAIAPGPITSTEIGTNYPADLGMLEKMAMMQKWAADRPNPISLLGRILDGFPESHRRFPSTRSNGGHTTETSICRHIDKDGYLHSKRITRTLNATGKELDKKVDEWVSPTKVWPENEQGGDRIVYQSVISKATASWEGGGAGEEVDEWEGNMGEEEKKWSKEDVPSRKREGKGLLDWLWK